MGSRVVNRLLNAGHTVTGYNRTRAKAQWLIDKGMRSADSPRQVAETADVIFTMVTNTQALLDVLHGENGILAGLGPGKIFIDMSTVSPAACRELARLIAAQGAQMLDAPVSGSVITLEQGTLSIMVGGDEATFEKVKAILLDIGPRSPASAGTRSPSRSRSRPPQSGGPDARL